MRWCPARLCLCGEKDVSRRHLHRSSSQVCMCPTVCVSVCLCVGCFIRPLTGRHNGSRRRHCLYASGYACPVRLRPRLPCPAESLLNYRPGEGRAESDVVAGPRAALYNHDFFIMFSVYCRRVPVYFSDSVPLLLISVPAHPAFIT